MNIKPTTKFQEFLSPIDFSDYNTVYELYQAIATLDSIGAFEVQTARGSDERWIIKTSDTDLPLLLCGQNARQTLINIIQDQYCGGMHPEAFYALHRAMEKDD